MNVTTIIMGFASIGFIIMGFIMLKSKKLKEILIISSMYKDTEKYICFNGKFNISVGIIGLVLIILDYLLDQKSNYIVIIFILFMLMATVAQKVAGKKYKV